MASQIFKRGSVAPEMNITPLIDVTFLLIIFFMLVNNIISEETVEMFVPDLTEPRTHAIGDIERVVVNVRPVDFLRADREVNPLMIDGRARGVRVGMQDFAMEDMAGVTAALRQAVERNPNVEVLLRADAALYYDEVQPVMVALTQAGIATVNLVAFMPEDPVPVVENGN
jgi:biopolymer transport protein TolR